MNTNLQDDEIEPSQLHSHIPGHATTSNRTSRCISEEPTIPPLFKLPLEIRDMIYEYVFTRLDGLHTTKYPDPDGNVRLYHAPGFHDAVGREIPGPEFNQLRYVCRQLRAETKGLELKYNKTLHFWKQKGITSYQLVQRFGSLCSPTSIQLVRRIIVHDDRTRWPWRKAHAPTISVYMDRFKDILDRYPKIIIVVAYEWWRFRGLRLRGNPYDMHSLAFTNAAYKALRGRPLLEGYEGALRIRQDSGSIRALGMFKFQCHERLRYKPPCGDYYWAVRNEVDDLSGEKEEKQRIRNIMKKLNEEGM